MLHIKYYILYKNWLLIDLINIYGYIGGMYVANYLMQTENKHHIVFRLTVLSHCFHSKHTITLTEYSKYTLGMKTMWCLLSVYIAAYI